MAVIYSEDTGDYEVENQNIEYTPLGVFAFIGDTTVIKRKVTFFAHNQTELSQEMEKIKNSYIVEGEPSIMQEAGGYRVSLNLIKKSTSGGGGGCGI